MARKLISTRTEAVFDKTGKKIGDLITNDWVNDATPTTPAPRLAAAIAPPPRPVGATRRLSVQEQNVNAMMKSRGARGSSCCGQWICSCGVPEAPGLSAVVERQRALGLRR